METPEQIIARLKRKCGVKSDYAIAKILGITRSNVSLLKTGQVKAFREDVGIRIADLLGENRGYILVCFNGARAPTPEIKTVWARVANHMRAAALGVTLITWSTALVTLAAPSPAHANIATATVPVLYIMSNWRRWWAAVRCWLSALRAAPCSAL